MNFGDWFALAAVNVQLTGTNGLGTGAWSVIPAVNLTVYVAPAVRSVPGFNVAIMPSAETETVAATGPDGPVSVKLVLVAPLIGSENVAETFEFNVTSAAPAFG